MIYEIIKATITGFCIGAVQSIIVWIVIYKAIKDKKSGN